MRFARTALGLLLTLTGLVVSLAGAAAAFWLVGPDNTMTTGNQQLTSKGMAVITAPDLLDRHGPVLHVTATGDKPVFIGVAQDLDVSNYLAGAAHTRLIRFDVPPAFGAQEMRGGEAQLTPPGELDWWVAHAGGEGKQSVAWPIQDGRYDVVVMNADGSPAVGAQVRFGVELPRAFGICLLVLGAGTLLLAIGLTLTFRRRRTPVPARAAVPRPPALTTPIRLPAPVVAPESTPVPPAAPAPAAAAVSSPATVYAPASQPPSLEPVDAAEPWDEQPVAATPITKAPLFMAPADVAKAKSPAFLVAVGAVAADENEMYDESPYDAGSSDEGLPPETPYGDQPADDVEPRPVSLAESPEFVRSDEAVRKTAALLASGALLLTTTSCGLLPAKNSAAAPATRPAVTLADAQAVVQRYNEVNNQANQSRDAELAATIEAGPTLAQTRAGYQIDRKLDAAGEDKTKSFTFTDPQIGAPEFGAYPMRFVVSSDVSTAPESRHLGVWQRQSAGTPWVLTNSVYPLKSTQLPPMEGLRTPAEADLGQLHSLPDSAATNLAAYLSAGPTSPNAKLFAPSPGMTKLLQQRVTAKAADTKQTYIASVADTFALSGEPLTFITSTGEAIVFLALTERYLQRVEPGSNAYWTSGDATAFSSMVKYTQTLHQDYLHQVALVIPTKAAGGTIRVLSIDGQLVGAGGT